MLTISSIKKILKAFSVVSGITTAGMAGGQKRFSKAVRRIGIPAIALIGSAMGGWRWKHLAFLFLIIPLSLGYGENSMLMRYIGSDGLVRVAYALLLSVPFWFFGFKRGLIAAGSLTLAFLVRAGSLGTVSWFGDLLIEDLIRYGVLGGLVAYTVVFDDR